MLKRENRVKDADPPKEWTARPEGVRVLEAGILAPRGFLASAVNAGLKKRGEPDVCLLVSQKACAAAGCFTTNRVQAAPVRICRRHLANPIQAVLVNSKCANSYTGAEGERDALELLGMLAEYFGLSPRNFLMASTGVIGERLPVRKIAAALPKLLGSLGDDAASAERASRAIMTTDTVPKTVACSFRTAGGEVRIGAMAKGAGMIAPRMATMLAFVTTDADLPRERLQAMLAEAVEASFNRVTVDGETSTNDTVLLLANAASGVKVSGREERRFREALGWVLRTLAWKVVADGEGVTKVFRVVVEGGRTDADAERVCRAVACSPLVKTAVFGEDFNWGRFVNAAGYSGAVFDPSRLDLDFDGHRVVAKGRPVPAGMAKAERAFRRPFFTVRLGLSAGKGRAEMLTSDFSYDYVRINADYRS